MIQDNGVGEPFVQSVAKIKTWVFREAKKSCAALPHPVLLTVGKQPAPLGALDAEIDALRERLGALDGREPDKIPVA